MVNPENLRVGDVIESHDNVLFTVGEIVEDVIRLTYNGRPYGSFHMYNRQTAKFWAGSHLRSSAPAGGGQQKATTPGHPRFLALLDDMRAMHIAKSADYGTNADVYANYRRAERLGVDPALGIALRMEDKMARIENYFKGGTLTCESVFDALMDLAGYALGAIVILQEKTTGDNGHAEKTSLDQRATQAGAGH